MSALLKKHSFHEIFDSQKAFRLVLEAISNPSRIVSIKDYADKFSGENAAFLALAMTLLDNEVSFCVCENKFLSEEIVSLTLSKEESPASADFVFLCETCSYEQVIQVVKRGSLADPHKSATVIIRNDEAAVCEINLHGPGIQDQITVSVSALVRNILWLRDQQYYEYPQGVDLLFVNRQGVLFAIPRLVKWGVT